MTSCMRSRRIKVTAVELKKKCRYHKRENQVYSSDSIAPKGLCFDAFHAAYPYCLALLYDADFTGSCHKNAGKDEVEIQCPMGCMRMRVTRIHSLPKPVKFLKTAAEKIFKRLLFPPDVPDYRIRIMVEESSSECPHKGGEEYYLNIRKTSELCPASFDALYPFLGVTDMRLVHCPDHEGILYEVARRQE